MVTRKNKTQSEDDGPSFARVWKLASTIFAGAASVAILAVVAWAWNLNSALAVLTGAVESNTKAIDWANTRLDRQADVIADHTARLAVQAAANVTTAERVRGMEQEQRWKERIGNQKGNR